MDLTLLLARLALAAVFAVAGVAKLLDLAGSRKAVQDFGVPARFASAAGLALPLAEIAIAVLLLPTATARWGAAGALVLLLVFIAAIGASVARGQAPDCHCFGQLHSEPAGPSTLIRNGILAAVAAFVLAAGWGDAGASLADPFGDLSGAETVLLIGGVLVLGAVALLGWVVVNLMSQNGRLLTRLDALEAALATGQPLAAAPDATAPATEQGLPVGTPAPAFSLPDLDGKSATLASLKRPGVPLMLLFTDPGCGPCNHILRQLNGWREAAGDRLDFAVISRGAREGNLVKAREHGLDRVLLQEGREVSQAYGATRTPSAVLIRPDGAIAAPLAGGAEAIQRLVGSSLTPRPAPAFALPSLDGGTVALDDLQAAGRPVVLFFTDAACDPCDLLLPEVARWQDDERDRLTVALVSRGTAEANRAKTAPYTLANVLLQTDLEVVNAYGLTQAPAVVIVQPDGTRDGAPAYGEHAIRSLMARVRGMQDPAAPPAALVMGEVVPALPLATLDGDRVDLAGTSATDRVLLFWNPGCGFCQRMVNDLRAWETDHATDAPELVVVSAGNAEAARAHGFTSTVLHDDGQGIGRRFGANGTPAAVRIDTQGRIASPVAVGKDAVLGLLGTRAPASANGLRDR